MTNKKVKNFMDQVVEALEDHKSYLEEGSSYMWA